jgi:hypothetical protein
MLHVAPNLPPNPPPPRTPTSPGIDGESSPSSDEEYECTGKGKGYKCTRKGNKKQSKKGNGKSKKANEAKDVEQSTEPQPEWTEVHILDVEQQEAMAKGKGRGFKKGTFIWYDPAVRASIWHGECGEETEWMSPYCNRPWIRDMSARQMVVTGEWMKSGPKGYGKFVLAPPKR